MPCDQVAAPAMLVALPARSRTPTASHTASVSQAMLVKDPAVSRGESTGSGRALATPQAPADSDATAGRPARSPTTRHVVASGHATSSDTKNPPPAPMSLV